MPSVPAAERCVMHVQFRACARTRCRHFQSRCSLSEASACQPRAHEHNLRAGTSLSGREQGISAPREATRPLDVPPRANDIPFGPEPPPQAGKPDWLREFEKDAPHDPQIAALLKGANGDPEVVQKRMMAYVTSDTEDVMSQDSGTPEPMDVIMRGIDPFNCWIWVELKDEPTAEDVETCSEVFKSWFILGRLGGFNSMNMQVLHGAEEGGDGVSYMKYDKEELDTSVDSTFHDISSTEQNGNWLRTWVNMGTADELALDVLVNAMSTFSRENVGIKQFVVGGENEDWPIPEAELPKSSMNPMSTKMPDDDYYGGDDSDEDVE